MGNDHMCMPQPGYIMQQLLCPYWIEPLYPNVDFIRVTKFNERNLYRTYVIDYDVKEEELRFLLLRVGVNQESVCLRAHTKVYSTDYRVSSLYIRQN